MSPLYAWERKHVGIQALSLFPDTQKPAPSSTKLFHTLLVRVYSFQFRLSSSRIIILLYIHFTSLYSGLFSQDFNMRTFATTDTNGRGHYGKNHRRWYGIESERPTTRLYREPKTKFTRTSPLSMVTNYAVHAVQN